MKFKKLNEKLVETVAKALKGARLTKFLDSIKIINDSLEQGGWVSRGSVKANSGFHQGISKIGCVNVEVCSPEWYASNEVSSLFTYGVWHHDKMVKARKYDDNGKEIALPYPSTEIGVLELGVKTIREHSKVFKLSDEVILAWFYLVREKDIAIHLLDSLRPLPSITSIGLSPKVTATLKECNLNLDLPSLKLAEIAFRFVQAVKWSKEQKKCLPVFDKNGACVLEKEYYPKWTDGIVHGQSRFAGGRHCEACGKAIPSGRFVAIEGFDKKSKNLISMWIGCDCAKNIFGIKDVGISK